MTDLTPFEDDPRYQALVDRADRALDETWGRIDAATHPVLDKATDLTKTVISLSAGALVLSLSVAQLLLQDPTSDAFLLGWLVPVAWVLLVVAIIAGVLRQGTIVTILAGRAVFEQHRSKIRRRIRQINLDGDVGAQFEEIAVEYDTDLSGTVFFSNGLAATMMVSFVIALIALVVFTIRNMPF